MCLLVVKPEGVLIEDVPWLCELATDSNADGFGVAWREDNKLFARKGLYKPKEQEKLINFIGGKEAILHWRFGTAGLNSKGNCHPFRLKDCYFAHNGVLPFEPTDKTISDTRYVAQRSETSVDLKKMVNHHISNFNKFAILTKNDIEILGEEYGEWEHDVWYSNMQWQDSYYNYCGFNQYKDEYQLKDALHQLVQDYGFYLVQKELNELRELDSYL